MKRLVWCTDIHLDHCKSNEDIIFFFEKIKYLDPDFLIIGGDISNSSSLFNHLDLIVKEFSDLPIYFVLGNHDYYGSSLKFIQSELKSWCKNTARNIFWLDESEIVKITDKTALIGNGLWCDWRAGNYKTSNVWLNDYLLIEELKFHPSSFEKLKKVIQHYSDLFSKVLLKNLNNAIEQGYKNIIILTHVPPFHEGSFYGGKVQDNNWAPHFVCKKAGDHIKEVMKNNSDIKCTVLSGHTHGSGFCDILPNLKAINGGARYKYPDVQQIIVAE